MRLHSFDHVQTLNQYFSEQLAMILTQAIAQRGHAYLVVSGGRTPVALFDLLAQTPINWAQVTITLADERQLPPTAQDSNERMVRTHLLQGFASQATFIGLCQNNDEAAINAAIAALPTFDAVILGMGEDGHTASLFPCSPEIHLGLADDTKQAIVNITPVSAPYQRISLTRKRLLNSRTVFLHLVGEKKLMVFNRAMAEQDFFAMPIRAFLHDPQVDIQVMYAP
ncbi:6-phosphogluconolactonase [Legionella nagasakiensis]|uniref:6-phosphogluconolactonase n=1 Tax=Legionella nagasakiensis TaxID=535290 RepID=UPI00105598EB|nr:6-phosphogluconolactonase [Legionella nagasakiensis]